jgi:hypothetical protein
VIGLTLFRLPQLPHQLIVQLDKMFKCFLYPSWNFTFKRSQQNTMDLIFDFKFPVNRLREGKGGIFKILHVLDFLETVHNFGQVLFEMVVCD